MADPHPFWMLFHERRVWELLELPPRVWTIGWVTHDSRTTDRQLRYDSGYRAGAAYPSYDPAFVDPTEGTVPQMWGWIADGFVGEEAIVEPAAEFATTSQVADRFEAWAAGPGAGREAIGMSGYQGTTADYPDRIRCNRLLGPGWVALHAADGTVGALVFERHDAGPGGYDLTGCDESGPYAYGATANGGAGEPQRRSVCEGLGAVEGRYVLVWTSADGGTLDVRDACGEFDDGRADLPVLDYDEDDPALARREASDAIVVGRMPRLVVCDG
jgi:hypothetical protein